MKDLPLEIILTAQDSGFEMSDELADKFFGRDSRVASR